MLKSAPPDAAAQHPAPRCGEGLSPRLNQRLGQPRQGAAKILGHVRDRTQRAAQPRLDDLAGGGGGGDLVHLDLLGVGLGVLAFPCIEYRGSRGRLQEEKCSFLKLFYVPVLFTVCSSWRGTREQKANKP